MALLRFWNRAQKRAVCRLCAGVLLVVLSVAGMLFHTRTIRVLSDHSAQRCWGGCGYEKEWKTEDDDVDPFWFYKLLNGEWHYQVGWVDVWRDTSLAGTIGLETTGAMACFWYNSHTDELGLPTYIHSAETIFGLECDRGRLFAHATGLLYPGTYYELTLGFGLGYEPLPGGPVINGYYDLYKGVYESDGTTTESNAGWFFGLGWPYRF